MYWNYLPEGSNLATLEDDGKHFRDLIEKLLTPEPSERMNIKDVLNHPWLKSYHVNKFAMKSKMAKLLN